MRLRYAIFGAVAFLALPPGGTAQTAPAPKQDAVASEPAPKLAAKKRAAATARTAASAPSLGIARRECVYKAVMTSEDMKACGINIR